MGQWQETLTSFLSLTDVYSPDFPRIVDEAAATRMAALKNDPYLVGYFIGNEPARPGREPECVPRAGGSFQADPQAAAGRARGQGPAGGPRALGSTVL